LIVVTVPAYNESKNLMKCVESLLHETPPLEEEFGIVIVEDGSTDGTDIIAQDLERMYPAVIYIHSAQKLGRGLALDARINYNHRNLNPMKRFTKLLRTMLSTPAVI